MTVILDAFALSYISVPKAACSSLKSMFFRVENHCPFPEFTANGRRWFVHDVYPSMAFPRLPHARIASHRRIAVVRDPLERLLSCYANRVVHYEELSEAHLSPEAIAAGASPDPDLRTFVDRLRLYREHSPSIHHHTNPLCHYLGAEPGYFERLFTLATLPALVALVAAATGQTLAIERLQTGGPKIGRDALTPGLISRLETFYEADYAAYGAYF